MDGNRTRIATDIRNWLPTSIDAAEPSLLARFPFSSCQLPVPMAAAMALEDRNDVPVSQNSDFFLLAVGPDGMVGVSTLVGCGGGLVERIWAAECVSKQQNGRLVANRRACVTGCWRRTREKSGLGPRMAKLEG